MPMVLPFVASGPESARRGIHSAKVEVEVVHVPNKTHAREQEFADVECMLDVCRMLVWSGFQSSGCRDVDERQSAWAAQ